MSDSTVKPHSRETRLHISNVVALVHYNEISIVLNILQWHFQLIYVTHRILVLVKDVLGALRTACNSGKLLWTWRISKRILPHWTKLFIIRSTKEANIKNELLSVNRCAYPIYCSCNQQYKLQLSLLSCAILFYRLLREVVYCKTKIIICSSNYSLS